MTVSTGKRQYLVPWQRYSLDGRQYLVRGFKPPVVIVRDHPDFADCVMVTPVALPWAGARVVRRDQLVPVDG